MTHLKLTIQYDGTNYYGWQRQKKGQTIQSKIEEVLSEIFKKDIKIRGAGRTDAGVHALGQVATFKTVLNFPLSNLRRALNSLLPSDIRILEIEEVDKDFHPQYSVKRKSYLYYVLNDDYCSPFIHRYVWHMREKIDLSKVFKSKHLFEGRRDFTPFCGSTEIKDKIRTVYSLTVELLDRIHFLDMHLRGRFIKFRIEADGFLKYMVRNIVGALIELGAGRLHEDAIIEAFNLGKRPNPLRTAPAKGLFLEKICY